MSLRGKLIAGFGGLLLILLTVCVLSVVVLTRHSHALEQIFRENYDSVIYCNNMKAALDSLNLRAQRVVWQSEPTSEVDAGVFIADFDRNVQLELANATLPREAELARKLAETWEQYRAEYQQFDAAPPFDRSRLYQDLLLPRLHSLERAADVVADINLQNMHSVDGRVKHTLTAVRDGMYVLTAAGVLLAIGLVAAVGASVLQPLRALTLSARQIGRADIELRVDVRSKDEIGQLAEAFNVMAARLRAVRKVDHERLLRTQETTQLAIDSLPDAVFVIGPEGRVEISNRTAGSYFGIAPDVPVAALALPWLTELYDDVHTSRQPWDPQGYQSAIQLFDDGVERFLLPRAVPMFNRDNALIGVTVILVDVTRLRQADELKSGLVSTVSHELRTPLTAIRMAVLMLADEKFGDLSSRQKKLLSAAAEDSDRLYRIIENLLSLSRIESGAQRFNFQPMRADEILALAIEPMQAQFAAKQIEFTTRSGADAPSLRADPTCVGYALSNLLSNAMKFTPAGGRVNVGVDYADGAATFSVTDTGPGVPETFASQLFHKFARVPGINRPAGVGLGLVIAKEIIEGHGGQIGYRPSQPSGSTFWFTLPVYAEVAIATQNVATQNSQS